MSKLTDIFQPKCIHRHTEKTHPKCFVNGKPVVKAEAQPAKVLSLDIETLPILGYTWGVWNVNIFSNQIVKDWCILSYSAKWLGTDSVISDVLTPKEAINRNDKRLITGIWNLLNEASIIVTHNGKRFDVRKINTRFWKHELHKPSSYKVIDTLEAAKSAFGLTYNKMSFIAEFIGADDKLDTNFQLWSACDNGDKKALQEMKEYNEQDVLTQEQIYLQMREWIPNHPDLGVYQNLNDVCPVCLSRNIQEIGVYTAKTKQYPEFRCDDCGSVWHRTGK